MFVQSTKAATNRRSDQRSHQFLSFYRNQPDIDVKTENFAVENYKVSCASMQGWRINMEDSHTCVLSMPCKPKWGFYGIYDGHGGSNVSKFLKMNLMNNIVSQFWPLLQKEEVSEALRNGFLATDRALLQKRFITGGSTAIVVVITDGKIYCANAGDSRAVASISGHASPLSFDHKPNNVEEMKRLQSTGGWVKCNRINGILAISRAFGDFEFKKNLSRGIENQTVTCFPDISIKEVNEDIEFIIMACDGVWEVKTNQEVVDFIRCQLSKNIRPDIALTNLLRDCVAKSTENVGMGGFDNMTAILICFLKSRPYRNFIHQCQVPKATNLDPHAFSMQLENGVYRTNRTIVHCKRHWGYPTVSEIPAMLS